MKTIYFFKYSIFLILFPALYTGFFPGKIVIVRTLCYLLFLFWFIYIYKKIPKKEFDTEKSFKFYMWFNAIMYARGSFNIMHWSDYLYFIDGLFPAFIFPLCLYLSSPNNLSQIYKSCMTIGIIMAIINAFYPPTDGMMTMAHNIMWLNIFIFFYPYIKKKYYFIILIAAFSIISYDFNRRSIMLGYLIPLIILLGFPFLKNIVIRKCIFYLGALTPIILLVFFTTNKFNIFEFMGEEYSVSIDEKTRQLTVDSRTGIYKDVTEAIFYSNEWYVPYIGLGGNGKVKTTNNGAASVGFENLRNGQEAGMLNYIQYGGIWGLIAYGFFLLTASYKALFKSKNDFMIMMGTFLLFKFLYSFIEDTIECNAHTYYHFLWIGMCFNTKLRIMTNQQIKEWINTVFKYSNKKTYAYCK